MSAGRKMVSVAVVPCEICKSKPITPNDPSEFVTVPCKCLAHFSCAQSDFENIKFSRFMTLLNWNRLNTIYAETMRMRGLP